MLSLAWPAFVWSCARLAVAADTQGEQHGEGEKGRRRGGKDWSEEGREEQEIGSVTSDSDHDC